MHWLAFLAACLALIGARSLRAPGRSGILMGSLIFSLAFAGTALAVRVLSDQAGLTRPSDYDAFVKDALRKANADPEAPLLVFVGASFSRNALDDEQLTRELRARGYPHRALTLSLEGASLQERDAHLKVFMKRTPRVPDSVFLEVAHEFDADPAYVFRVAKFSDRAIEQMSPEAAGWSVRGLAQRQCDGLAACLKSGVFLTLHAIMNLSNIGLLATGETFGEIPAKPSFDPQETPRETFALKPSDIDRHLKASGNIRPGEGPDWARQFRDSQRARLSSEGVRRVAYYYPPVLPEADRRYAAELCAGELTDFPCIAPVDTVLLDQLRGPYWFDEKHLLREGADIYTGWLAGQIDSLGALK